MANAYGPKGTAGVLGHGRAPAGLDGAPAVGQGLPGLPSRHSKPIAGEFILERRLIDGNKYADQVFIVPPGVYSISVLAIGAGLSGATGQSGTASTGGQGGLGGAGGSSYYLNDIAVQPGEIIVHSPSMFRGMAIAAAFTLIATAPAGLRGGTGTLSAAGATGIGGNGLNLINGAGGPAGTAKFGGDYANPSPRGARFGGGGGGGGGGMRGGAFAGQSGDLADWGAVRIIWPGNLRQFPYTRTEEES